MYSVNSIGDNGISNNELKRLDQNSGAANSCVPVGPGSFRETNRQTISSSLTGQTFYVDVDVPAELRSKVGLKYL